MTSSINDIQLHRRKQYSQEVNFVYSTWTELNTTALNFRSENVYSNESVHNIRAEHQPF